MLTIVQSQPIVHDPSGATAQLWRRLQQTHSKTRLGGTYGRSQTGPAAADDGQGVQKRPKACIFQASQNLRKGVSATRWCSTGKPAAWISTNKVR